MNFPLNILLSKVKEIFHKTLIFVCRSFRAICAPKSSHDKKEKFYETECRVPQRNYSYLCWMLS